MVKKYNKLVEDYLERLTKLFNHSHEFLTLEQIECLKCKDYDYTYGLSISHALAAVSIK